MKASQLFSPEQLADASFIEGKAKDILSPADCKLVGREAARMHELTKTFKLKRQNDLSINSWRKIFNSSSKRSSS